MGTILGLIIAIFITSVITKRPILFPISFLLISLGLFFLPKMELSAIERKVKPFFEDGDYYGAIEYLNDAFNRCFFIVNVYSCLVSLVITYMLIGNTNKAKDLLAKYKTLRNNPNLFYIQMIILISENKYEEANYYQRKLMNSRSSKLITQKNSSIEVLSMLEKGEFNEKIYNDTKFPLLKDICLCYKDGIIKGTFLLGGKDLIKNSQKESKVIKSISFILNIMMPLSLLVALAFVSLSSERYGPITTIDGLYYSLMNIWIFWLFLPLTLGSLIFGLIYKKKNNKTKGNIIMGVIFSILLLAFGSFYLIGLKQYQTDTEYLYNIGELIKVDFPPPAKVITQNWMQGKQTSSSNILLKYTSVVKYNSEVSAFENSLNKPHWINSLPANSFLPMVFTVQTTGYEKFLLYCIETGEYNPEFAQVNYNYIAIGYSKKNKGLIIYEFTTK